MLQAQISPLADQFLINPMLTNPAYTGTESRAPFSVAARRQWLGIKGAPTWQTATWHRNLNAGKKHFNPWGFINKGQNSFGNVGIGAGIFHVRCGAISQAGLHFDYGYHIFLRKGRLSFGLAPMYLQYVIDKSEFIPPDGSGSDPLIDGKNKEIVHFFDFNAGVHYFSKNLFAGFSTIQLTNSAVSFGDLSFATMGKATDNPYLARSFYVYGGFTLLPESKIRMEPSLLVKYNGQSGFGFHVNLVTTILDNIQAGLLYRYRESAGLFAGISINDLIIRYQFEAPVGTDMQTRFTTSQILVGYLL